MSRTYLVECYGPGSAGAARTDVVDRVAGAARANREVSFLDGMILPSDDVVFYRFAGPGADEVAAVCAAAGLAVTRISEYAALVGRVGVRSAGPRSAVGAGEIEP